MKWVTNEEKKTTTLYEINDTCYYIKRVLHWRKKKIKINDTYNALNEIGDTTGKIYMPLMMHKMYYMKWVLH